MTPNEICSEIAFHDKRSLRQSRFTRHWLRAAVRHVIEFLAVVTVLWLWATWAMGMWG